HRFVEERADQTLQNHRLELKVDEEVDDAAAGRLFENPVIVEMAKRTFGIGNINSVWRAQGDARGESLAHHLEADHQVGDDDVILAAAYPSSDAPGEKFRVALHVGNQRVKLLR